MGYGIRLCRHCSRGEVTRPRGLCWSCYYKPTVREGYETQYARGIGTEQPVRSASGPTTAPPGSKEKLAVLIERCSRGEKLWHPDDARLDNVVYDPALMLMTFGRHHGPQPGKGHSLVG